VVARSRKRDVDQGLQEEEKVPKLGKRRAAVKERNSDRERMTKR